MTSIETLKREVAELTIKVNPVTKHYVLIMGSTETEHKQHYKELMANPANKFMKADTHPFSTWEKYWSYFKDQKIEEIHIYG